MITPTSADKLPHQRKTPMPLIKRYPNRKLYDTEAKRYVKLEEIAQMIQGGAEVAVIDYESGDDLTSLTLSQVILEMEKRQSGFLPTALMTSLIRTGGDTLDFLLRQVQGSLPAGAGVIEDRLKQLVNAGKLSAEQAKSVALALQHEGRELTRLDENMAAILHRLNIPTNRDIVELRDKLTQLTEHLNALASQVDEGE
jgi:polyhydroxyalkanoate synthesis repressor PhaR